jgi:hypothetical protein
VTLSSSIFPLSIFERSKMSLMSASNVLRVVPKRGKMKHEQVGRTRLIKRGVKSVVTCHRIGWC